MKHTPGPWEVVIGARKDGSGDELLITTVGQQRIVAKISPMDGLDEQDEPNAFLIAAVTDLLEACRAIIDAHDDLFNQCCSNPLKNAWGQGVNMTKTNEAYGLARAAIAKAGGK